MHQSRRSRMIVVRSEAIEVKKWAGDPLKVSSDPSAFKDRPRRSSNTTKFRPYRLSFFLFQDRTSLILMDSPLSPKTAHFRFYPWDAWYSYCSKRIKLFSVSSFQFQLYFLTSAPTFQLHSIQFNFEHSDLTLSNFCYVFFQRSYYM